MKRRLTFMLTLTTMFLSITQGIAKPVDVQPTDTATITKLTKLDMDGMDIDQLITISGMGLFMNTGDGEYKSLDRERCPDFEKFMLLDNMWYDQLVATGDRFLIRNGCQVYEIDKTKCELVANFDTPCFRLFAGNDSIFYMIVYNNEGSTIYSCRFADGTITPLVTQKEDIMRIEAMGEGFAFIVGNTLFYADGKELHHLFDTEESLTDMVLTQNGMLFCTDTSLYIYDGEKVIPLASDDFCRLFYDNGRTYIVLADGTVYRSDIF